MIKSSKCICVALGVLSAISALGEDSIGFMFVANHADALYRLGEEAVFTVTATNGSGAKVTSGKVTARLDNYGTNVLMNLAIDLAKTNPFVLRGKLDEPGFLRVSASGDNVGKRSPVRWGVAYEPTKIVPGGKCPEDFDAFWKSARESLAKTVPLDPRMERDAAKSTNQFDYYRVSFATYGGTRVWGFLSIPTDKSKAPFPVIFETPSGGEGRWVMEMAGRADCIRMYMTVHEFEPPRNADELPECFRKLRESLAARGQSTTYERAGLDGKTEDYYFYRAILGIDRAVDWLWARNDVDRTRFEYTGGSQGGCFGWFLCGLNHKFTSAVLRVPAGSDTRGYLAGRCVGWPNPRCQYAGEKLARAERNMGYFDGASFAPRITCPVRVTVGMIDDICPPPTIYATYNAIGSKDKQILNGIGCGHGGQTWFYDEIACRWQEEFRASGRPKAGTRIPLWKGARIPFDVRPHRPEKIVEYGATSDVFDPWMEFHPAKGDGPHPAVIVCPGGGYFRLGIPAAVKVADWLNGLGYDAFVLAYRVSPEKNPDGAHADAERALLLIRTAAATWGIDPNRVGMIGFSAGANLTARTSCGQFRPDFAMTIYPYWMEREPNTTENHRFIARSGYVPDVHSPRTFIVQTQDDVCRVESALTYYIGLKYAGVPVEMHLFDAGGHGYGLAERHKTGVELWPRLAEKWLERMPALR